MSIRRCGPALLVSLLGAYAFGVTTDAQTPTPPATPDAARAFLAKVNSDLLRLSESGNRAGWIQSTYITTDTEAMAAQAYEALLTAATQFAKDATRFQKTQVPAAERRQLELLRTSLTMAAPPDPKEAEELTRLAASMEGDYGRAKYCPPARPATTVSTSRR